MAASLALSGMTAMAASSGKCGENLTWTLDDEGACRHRYRCNVQL